MRRFLLIGSLLVASRSAHAEDLALRDALARALAQNPALAAEAIDIAVAEARMRAATGTEDWVVDGSGGVLFSRTGKVEGQPFQQTAMDRYDLSGGLTRGLGNGGRAGVRLGGSYTRAITEIDFGVSEEVETTTWAPSVSATYFQPLLRGFGEVAARAERRRARAQRDVDELERAGAAGDLVRDVVNAYWELAYALQEVDIRKASLALAKEQVRLTQARIDAKVGAPSDIAAAEHGVAINEEAVLLSELAVAERSLELRRLIGVKIEANAPDLSATDRPEVTAGDVDVAEALARAVDHNPQLAIVRARGAQADIEVEVTKNGLLPQLDFNASAGPSGTADNAGDAFEQLGKFHSYAFQAGVQFSMPLGNQGAEGAHEAARQSARKVRVTAADLEAQISVAVVRTVNLVRTAAKRLEVLEKASKLAQVNLDAEKARFDVGRATNFDIQKRTEELSESRLRQARARTDYLKALAVLEALTGDILTRYGVELKAR